LAILNISLPGTSGLTILAIANSEKLPTRLVFFAEPATSAAAGAFGIIPDDVTAAVLVQSLRQVAHGQRVLPLLSSDQTVPEMDAVVWENALAVLTDREREIMHLVSQGLSNKQIGRQLNISFGTIKVHLHHIYQKLEINNRTVLAGLAISHNDRSGITSQDAVSPHLPQGNGK